MIFIEEEKKKTTDAQLQQHPFNASTTNTNPTQSLLLSTVLQTHRAHTGKDYLAKIHSQFSSFNQSQQRKMNNG